VYRLGIVVLGRDNNLSSSAILAITESWRGKEGGVDLKERALAGTLGGIGATLALSGLRETWTRV
jgi:hypothetical protein